MRLRDGSTTHVTMLDLIFDKDPRNRDYPAMAVAPEAWEKIDREWPRSPVTDQGGEGACVGHGWAGWAAGMGVLDLTAPELERYAYEAYHVIQHGDDWDGCHLGPKCPVAPNPETYGGTSVKAGGVQMADRGLVESFTWAFGIDEALKALTTVGPLVLGTAWHDGMYEAPGGILTISGAKVGAHCYKADAIYWRDEEIGVQNSWGTGWGVDGRARLSFAAFQALLEDDGEVCVPLKPQQVSTQP